MAQSGDKSIAKARTASSVTIANINLTGLTLSLKLTRENFLLWKTQLIPILAAYELMDLLEQDPPAISFLDKERRVCPNPAYKAWFKNDKIVLSIITSSLSESIMSIVVGKETAKAAWDAINRNFTGRSRSRVMELQTNLHNLRKGTMSVETYVQSIRTLGDELRTCGSPMEPNDLTLALLRGLGPQYNAFYASTNQFLETLTFDDVVANLNTYDLHLSRQNLEYSSTEFSPSANYLQAQSQDQKNNGRGGKSNQGRGRGQKLAPRCQLCFKTGHRVINCYERFNRNFQQPNFHDFINSQQNQGQQPQANLTNTQNTSGFQNTWYPDSGSTHHVTNDINNIQNPSIYTGRDQLFVGNGQGLHISFIGSSNLQFNT